MVNGLILKALFYSPRALTALYTTFTQFHTLMDASQSHLGLFGFQTGSNQQPSDQ